MKQLKRMMVIVFCVSLGVLVSSPAMAFLDNKFVKEVEKETGAVKLVREVQKGGYDVVRTDELKTWIDEGRNLVIVDTMPYEASYKKNHIPGAVQFLFPIPDMMQWDNAETAGKSKEDYDSLLGGDKDKTIVVYCGFVKCTRSHNGALWAKKLGYKNVYRYPGGIFAWKGAKHEVAKEE
ncbi:MAG: rhodanese-like domain-containing protein [Desulfobacteraceae bacterium]|nr:MAG: rhodanese-like domain-containing protein [Desulfobacteraceae bacterium]